MAMKDLGVKHKHPMVAEMSDKEHSKSYPSMTIDHKSGLNLHKHPVGKTGHMKIKYKVTGQPAYRDGTGHTNLDITHADHEESAKHEAGESAAKEKKEEGK